MSPYISLVTVEAWDRNRSTLQLITPSEQALWNEYDTSESIPFVDISNQFVLMQAQYDPQTLSGTSWGQIANQLSNSSSTYAKNIDGAANIIISDICAVDGNNTPSVCTQLFSQNSGSTTTTWIALSFIEVYLKTISTFVLLDIFLLTNSNFETATNSIKFHLSDRICLTQKCT
jgi:hypothetical protein